MSMASTGAAGAFVRLLLCVIIVTTAIDAFRSLNQNPWLKYKTALTNADPGKRNKQGKHLKT